MTNLHQHQIEALEGRYGLRVAARLSAGMADFPRDISERLRIARTQALARRKVRKAAHAAPIWSSAGAATLGFGDEGLNWFNRIASALPLLALVLGLVAINAIQNENSAREVAALDAALLVDDLPLAAYADSGFLQFIKAGSGQAQ